MKIVVDNKIPFLRGALEPYAEIIYLPGAEISRKHLLDADALITRTRTMCDESTLAGTKVKFIASATIGFDHINTEWCAKNGVAWQNAPGCNSSSVQQYIASALLNLAANKGRELREMTIGIIGVGNVGSKIAKFAENIGMQTLLNDPPLARKWRRDEEAERRRNTAHDGQTCPYVDINQILAEADIITLHVPMNKEGEDATWHLVEKKFISQMKSGAWLLNSSRGAVVDGHALKSAMLNGKIAAAVLDVWENEPTIDTELLDTVDFGTPHIAGYSADGKANGTAMSVQGISRFFGLGIDDWFPSEIPVPEKCRIELPDGLPMQEILRRAVNNTYDIHEDDARLRAASEKFESQRGNYPLRREFHNYKIKAHSLQNEALELLRKIGFN